MVNNAKKTIIVPWDFTEESEIVLAHAYQLAQVVGDNIMLVNIVRQPSRFTSRSKKNRFEESLEQRRELLEQQAAELSASCEAHRLVLAKSLEQNGSTKLKELHPVSILTLVLSFNNLKKALWDLYLSMDVNLVVAKQAYRYENGMMINLVKTLSSIKVGATNTVPFIIVNKMPTHSYYTEIVLPMDYRSTYKETLRWIAFLSNYYRCNINLIKPHVRDEGKKRRVANNLYFTKKILDSRNVIYGVKTASRRGDFRAEVFKFTKAIDADLLIIMTDKMKSYFSGYSIDAEMPIMFINPLSKRYQPFY